METGTVCSVMINVDDFTGIPNQGLGVRVGSIFTHALFL